MDTNTLIFLGTLMLFSLGLGISGFIGNKAEAYSPLTFSTRLVLAGILIALILFVGLTQPPTDKADYLLSYICLFLGVVFFFSAIAAHRQKWVAPME